MMMMNSICSGFFGVNQTVFRALSVAGVLGAFLFANTYVYAAYTEPASYTNPSKVVTIGSSGYSVAGANDTDTFRKAVDDVAAAGGGRVVVPAGDYSFADISMKNNVHVVFDGPSTIRPYVGGLASDASVSLFSAGFSGTTNDFSVRGVNGWSQFVFDNHSKLRAFNLADAQNFLLSNFHVRDTRTVFSSIELTWRAGERPDGSMRIPTDGTIQHIRTANADFGYGTTQIQASQNVLFKDLETVGGGALRAETGWKTMIKAHGGGVHDIVGEDIRVYSGQAAAKLGAHGTHNGNVTVRDITAVNSEYAARIEWGSLHKFSDSEIEQYDLTPGDFDSILIDGVDATYSEGPIETKWSTIDDYRESQHPLVYQVPSTGSSLNVYRGPSAGVVLNPRPFDPTIVIENVEAHGFEHLSEAPYTGKPSQALTKAIPPNGRLLGDINDDEIWTVDDLDMLFDNFGSVPVGGLYDLANKDGIADMDDVSFWLRSVMGSEFGDANLDGRVSPMDIDILAARFDQAGTWRDGDFNGDGMVDLDDLTILGTYYKPHVADGIIGFDTAVVAAGLVVPEPRCAVFMTFTALGFCARRRRVMQ